jgi:hypothetical protein
LSKLALQFYHFGAVVILTNAFSAATDRPYIIDFSEGKWTGGEAAMGVILGLVIDR